MDGSRLRVDLVMMVRGLDSSVYEVTMHEMTMMKWHDMVQA